MPPLPPSFRQLDDLALFVRLAEHPTLSAAARELRIAKSTLSRRVSRLEDWLGARLLQRNSKSISLTEAGSVLRARCATALQQISEAASSVSGSVKAESGRIRVSVPHDFGI